MDDDELKSYYPSKHEDDLFYKVIALQKAHEFTWESASSQMPLLPRGWFELSRLCVEDRIEFTRAFWLSKLSFNSPATSHLESKIDFFFDELEDVEVFATQVDPSQPFDVHMVYTLKQGAGFFQGSPPASAESVQRLQKQFSFVNFPPDYLAFLSIHDGFSKYLDTGLIKTRDLTRIYRHFQELLGDIMLVRPDGQPIKPQSLIPFYESFGLHCYQCFYADWYVESEMGNVYFSQHEQAVSNFLDSSQLEENLAFPTFLGWLVFYLEDIWHL